MSSTLFTGIELVAATLMGGITLGVIYLTLTGWRDRRRREDEAREARKTARFK
jgi:type II secretory pathway pseudopilin PulG